MARAFEIGRKAVSGKVLTMVAELVLAIAALLLLWAFLSGSVPLISGAIDNMVTGFKRMLCNVGILTWVCKTALGV
jgi:hypothetical protein